MSAPIHPFPMLQQLPFRNIWPLAWSNIWAVGCQRSLPGRASRNPKGAQPPLSSTCRAVLRELALLGFQAGDCTSRRLDHGCNIPSRKAALATDFFTAIPRSANKSKTYGFRFLLGPVLLVNANQRCGYGDSPFARKDTFLYCRVWKWVGGDG